MLLGLAGIESDASTPAAEAPRPPGFRPAGGVRAAWSLGEGPFGRTPLAASRQATPAQRAGLRYERKVKAELQKRLGEAFRPGLWFKFESDSEASPRWCQVDGLMVQQDHVTIFEMKTRNFPEAWWQLHELYVPVVRRAFYAKTVATVLICRTFDPMVRFPQEARLLDPEQLSLTARAEGFCVVPWRL